jgi:hypothetical protein
MRFMLPLELLAWNMAQTINDPSFNFEANPTLEELLEQQGKGPVNDLSIFQGDWPDDEPIRGFPRGAPRVARARQERPK